MWRCYHILAGAHHRHMHAVQGLMRMYDDTFSASSSFCVLALHLPLTLRCAISVRSVTSSCAWLGCPQACFSWGGSHHGRLMWLPEELPFSPTFCKRHAWGHACYRFAVVMQCCQGGQG